MATCVKVCFLLLVGIFHICTACKYISLGSDHTMCQFKGDGCKIVKRGLSPTEQAEAVKIHNELRQKVANGEQKNQPGASNMKVVKWNDELAAIAQRWTEQCRGVKHDSNRNTMTYPDVGQNMYSSSSSGPISFDLMYTVTKWYNEVDNPGFNRGHINPYVWTKGIGHYTQVVWAETETIGCGYSLYVDGNGDNRQTFACNYGPSGNFKDTAMYEEGKACSKCDTGKCSNTYPGLCE